MPVKHPQPQSRAGAVMGTTPGTFYRRVGIWSDQTPVTLSENFHKVKCESMWKCATRALLCATKDCHLRFIYTRNIQYDV